VPDELRSVTSWESPLDTFLFLALHSHVREQFLLPYHTFASAAHLLNDHGHRPDRAQGERSGGGREKDVDARGDGIRARNAAGCLCMCVIAWLILGLIAGFMASGSVGSSGAVDFRRPPPHIQPYYGHPRFRQSQYLCVPCVRGKRSIREPQKSCARGSASWRAGSIPMLRQST
jgi:hypothetical protein